MAGKNLFLHLSGLGSPESELFRIMVEDGFLLLDCVKPHAFGKDKLIQQYKIDASRVLDFDIVKIADVENKSVIARGVAGGLLLGPVGAVLGGMSAADKRKIKSTLAISYLPSSGGDPKTVVFNMDLPSWSSKNALSIVNLQKALSKIEKCKEVMDYLGQTQNADGSISL